MERLSLPSTVFLFSSLLLATSNGDFSTGANQAIRCMLLQISSDCNSLPEVAVPSYLVEAFNECPNSTHEALRSGPLKHLSNAQVASLPISLLYLIPRGRLAELNGTQLGAILYRHADDTSLAQQVAASLQHGRHLVQLIHKLKVSTLSQEVLQILGEYINILDINKDLINSPFLLQEPLLAYIRPNVLFKFDVNTVYQLVFLFQKLEPSKIPKKAAVKFLSEAAIRNNVPLTKVNWFVLGLTPDQLKNETFVYDLSVTNFKLDLTRLQVRALFERIYYNITLTQSHFIDCKPLLYKLSPALLQRFPTRLHKYNTDDNPHSPLSLSTAFQITEYVKADCKLTGKLPKEEQEKWGSRIRYLEQWVFTLSLTHLQEYLGEGLNTAALKTIESSALSPIQAYYLTGKGDSLDVGAANSVLGLSIFLHGLPASQLVGHKVDNIGSSVLQHLVANLPTDNFPRTLSLVYRIATIIGEPFIMENLLDNNNINTILSLVSPKDLRTSASGILKIFADKKDIHGSVIQRLPQQVLAALLDQAQSNTQWSWRSLLDSSQVSHLLLGGLTCQHIENMDTGLFIPIIAQYNRQKKEAFPKNLQRCCLQKLISHMKLKMTLTQTDHRHGLISMLEPIEVESVGGYVLVGLPVQVLKVSPYLGYILAAIGKLSCAELILAANMSQLQAVAQLAVDKEGNVDVFFAGNLVWFLPQNINVPGLRLMLESGKLDTTLCLSAKYRRHVATRLLGEFGPPETWSASVLATLQDLLIVFTNHELLNVSKIAWTEAADSLVSHYGDSINWIEPSPFYQVCGSIIGKSEETEFMSAVTHLVRLHLRAAQWQLDTVQYISHTNTPKSTMTLDQLNLDLQSEVTVNVFNPSEVWESSTIESLTEEITTEENTTEESTTEESTTTESTTEARTTNESTTDKSTIVVSTSEESTTKESTTEQSTTKESTTKIIIEENTSKVTITENPTSQEITNEKTITVENVSNELREGSTIKNCSFDCLVTTTKKSILKGNTFESKTTEKSAAFNTGNPLHSTENITSANKDHTFTDQRKSTTVPSFSSASATENIQSESIFEQPTPEEVYKVTVKHTTSGKTFNDFSFSESETEQTISSDEMSISTPTMTVNLNNSFNYDIESTTAQFSVVTAFSEIKENNKESNDSFSDEISKDTITNEEEALTNGNDNSSTKLTVEPVVNIKPSTRSNNTISYFQHIVNGNKTSNVQPLNGSNSYSANSNISKPLIQNNNSISQLVKQSTLKPNISLTTTISPFQKTINENKTNNVQPLNGSNIYPANSKTLKPLIQNNNMSQPVNQASLKTNTSLTTKSVNNSSNPATELNIMGDNNKKNQTGDGEEMKEDDDELYSDEDENGISILDKTSKTNFRRKRNSGHPKVSCNALKMVGKLAGLALTVKDLEEMSDSEVDDCRVELGAMELSLSHHKEIWKRINKEDGVHLLGNLLQVTTVGDLWDLKFDINTAWALETIHAFNKNVNNTIVLEKIINLVQRHNSELPQELLAVMGNSLCSLEPDSLQSLVVAGLEPLPHCPTCLPLLAMKAIEQLGDVTLWTPHYVYALHTIIAGLNLEDWKVLISSPYKPLSALQPSAIKCLNNSHLEVLSPDQIRMIPTLTLYALTDQQKAALNTSQLWALGNSTQLSVSEELTPTKRMYVAGASSGGHVLEPAILIVFICLVHTLKLV